MISNFIDWVVDSLYAAKWFVEDVVRWEVESLTSALQEIWRIKKK